MQNIDDKKEYNKTTGRRSDLDKTINQEHPDKLLIDIPISHFAPCIDHDITGHQSTDFTCHRNTQLNFGFKIQFWDCYLNQVLFKMHQTKSQLMIINLETYETMILKNIVLKFLKDVF